MSTDRELLEQSIKHIEWLFDYLKGHETMSWVHGWRPEDEIITKGAEIVSYLSATKEHLKKEIVPSLKMVFGVKWMESERGWGMRPDGFSLHLTPELRDKYVKECNERERALYGNQVPDEYSFAADLNVVLVDEELYAKIAEVGSIRSYKRFVPQEKPHYTLKDI